jgi:hypothetical protein
MLWSQLVPPNVSRQRTSELKNEDVVHDPASHSTRLLVKVEDWQVGVDAPLFLLSHQIDSPLKIPLTQSPPRHSVTSAFPEAAKRQSSKLTKQFVFSLDEVQIMRTFCKQTRY